MKDTKKALVFTRVTQKEKDEFVNKSKEHGGQSTVLRSLIARFNNNTITLKKETK